MKRGLSLALVLAGACGGTTVATETNEPQRNEWGDIVTDRRDPIMSPAPFEVLPFVRAYAVPRVRVFLPIEEEESALSRALRTARGAAARREAQFRLYVRRFQRAEGAEGTERTTILRTMAREERTLLRGNTDVRLAAEVAFMKLWLDYAAGDYAARAKAEAFVTDHAAQQDLVRIVTVIRAELALAQHEVANSRALFETLRAAPSDELSGYARYRAARMLCADGQLEPCRRELEDARVFGCAADASATTQDFAARAATELDTPRRRDAPSGTPDHCTAADVTRAGTLATTGSGGSP